MRSLRLILLLVLGTGIFLWLIKAPVVSSYLTLRMGVPVSVGSISVRPEHTTIRSFKIRNPQGFQTPDAFRAQTISVGYTLANLRKDPVEIDEIEIDGIYLAIDLRDPLGKSNNWKQIGEKMTATRGTTEVIIHKLVLTDIDVEIRGLGIFTTPKKQHIDRIELDQVNSSRGFPTEELVQKFFQSAGLESYIEDAFNPANVIEKALNPFQQLLN
jgi:hypothetical protein